MAVAHSLVHIIYHMIATGATYQDLGGDYFEQRDKEAAERRGPGDPEEARLPRRAAHDGAGRVTSTCGRSVRFQVPGWRVFSLRAQRQNLHRYQ